MGRRLKYSKERKVWAKMYQDGHSLNTIAEKYDIHHETVNINLIKMGIRSRYKERPAKYSKVDRFNELVIKNKDGCWDWKGTIRNDKYGVFKAEGSLHMAHRVSYELHKGQIADGLYVCHTCDNPRCSNPKHLFLGTTTDNALDMMVKGRSGMAKLRPTDIPPIREMIRKGQKDKDIAASFGVHKDTIWAIRKGVSWAYIK